MDKILNELRKQLESRNSLLSGGPASDIGQEWFARTKELLAKVDSGMSKEFDDLSQKLSLPVSVFAREPVLNRMFVILRQAINYLELEDKNTKTGVSKEDSGKGEGRKLKEQIDEFFELAEKKVLEGEELNKLVLELRAYHIPSSAGTILYREIEKLQKEPNTVWSDNKGYAIGGKELLSPWKELFSRLFPETEKPEQRYFSPGSQDEIFNHLKTLFPGRKTIRVFDNYLDEKILKLLETAHPEAEIFLLSKKYKSVFIQKLDAFRVYFGKKIKAKIASISHDRFYIVDGNVYSLGTSLKGEGITKATLFTPLNELEAKKLSEDFDEWWMSAEDLVS